MAAGLTQVLAETTDGQTITYLYGLGLVGQTAGGVTEYHLTDALGSVRQLADAGGSVQLAQTFDAYGNLYAQSGGSRPSFGWTGEQSDANGLTYLRARYYAPSMGRFTQIDPFAGALAIPASMNGYGYAHGSPVRYTDPSGEFPILIALALIGAAAFGGAAYGYQVHSNMQQGMDFWNAAYYKNINWGTVGIAAGVGAVALPLAYLGLQALPGLAGRALGQAATWETLGGEAFFEFSVATVHGFNFAGKALMAYGLYDALVDDPLTWWLSLNGNLDAANQIVGLGAYFGIQNPLDGPNLAFALLAGGGRAFRRGLNFSVDDLGISSDDFDLSSQTRQRGYPLGFESIEDFINFGRLLRQGLEEAGYNDTAIVFQGSSVTGRSADTGEPFDYGRISDFDVAIVSDSFMLRAMEEGISAKTAPSGRLRTGPIDDLAKFQALGLTHVQQYLSELTGRAINFMGYEMLNDALYDSSKPGIRVPGG